jgi:ATP-binding protein involved in chromosome partitioning
LATEAMVLEALRTVKDPELGQDLVSLEMIQDLVVKGSHVSFTLRLTTPACPLKSQIRDSAREAVLKIPGVVEVEVELQARVQAHLSGAKANMLPGVRNTVAVASGKGGVGKSTVSVNLALALVECGARVGLLDADVYGPSVPMMLGIHEEPEHRDGRIIPLVKFGLKLMSVGFLVEPEAALIWRGPLVGKMIKQFLSDVEWGELDYLIIDLPPGTGDASLTVAQMVPLTGVILVTTPQDVALADVIKARAMFKKLKVNILGIVENMSYFVCPHCGERTNVFSHGGGKRASSELGIPYLGDIPLDTQVRVGGDTGQPIVATHPDSPLAKAFLRLATEAAATISRIGLSHAGAAQ